MSKKAFFVRVDHPMSDCETVERVAAENEDDARRVVESVGFTAYEVWEAEEEE